MKPFLRKGRNKLHVKVRRADGKWSQPIATPFDPEQKDEASAFRDQLQAKVDAGFSPEGPLTVRAYYDRWIKTRDNDSKADDISRMTLHVLPELGQMRMEEVRPRHVRDLVKKLRREKALERVGIDKYKRSSRTLAPRTVINIYAVLHAMFRDAVVDEVVRSSPCVLRRGDLPAKHDADPEWRAGAVFTRAELERIISSDKIPADRRTFYALLFLTASRFGEVSALRWRHYDSEAKPLGRILIASSYSTKAKAIKSTKTKGTRKAPVHPVLAAILAEWQLTGWPELTGRKHPEPDDLIVPSREGSNRSVNHMLKRFHEDLERVGLRSRRQHDTRRTFRSIALDDGANPARVPWITHGRPSGIDGDYDEPAWWSLCEVVSAMRIHRRSKKLAAFGANGATRGDADPTNTEHAEDRRA